MMEITDTQKIGVGLAGFGISFIFLGMILFFDKGLLAIGNLLFIVGLTFVIGIERTFRFFFQRHKIKATCCFFGGILVVLVGWPIVGIIIESYGFVLLFGGFLSVAINFLRRVPVLGNILNLPGLKQGQESHMVDFTPSNEFLTNFNIKIDYFGRHREYLRLFL